MAKSAKPSKSRITAAAASGNHLFELEVALVQGPITEEFAKRNPQVLRTIQIRGDQTLQDLHDEIFKAHDRFEEHMYEFQIGGTRLMDPKARTYVLPMAMDDAWSDPRPAGRVDKTTIASLNLNKDDVFAYWFDFGDDWWHQINVIAIHAEIPKGKFLRITSRTGDSPPQYPDMDDEDGDDDDDEDEE